MANAWKIPDAGSVKPGLLGSNEHRAEMPFIPLQGTIDGVQKPIFVIRQAAV
jgi:hypothetical protein